jgi:DnaK suppressor protein
MNKRDMTKFKKLLLSERSRIAGELRNIEESTLGGSGNADSDFSSLTEVGTDNFERETALSVAANEAEAVAQIDEALQKIEEAAYGDCEGCEKPIPKKRLEVYPWARHCVECQAKLERDGYL